MERRLHTRHRARTAVYVSVPGRPGKLCRARNLSANGVFIETENLGLKKGATVHLAFAINLGVVTARFIVAPRSLRTSREAAPGR